MSGKASVRFVLSLRGEKRGERALSQPEGSPGTRACPGRGLVLLRIRRERDR